MDLFGEDSNGDEIPCGQQQNMERLLQLAEELGSKGQTFEEDLLVPPIVAPILQPQPQLAPVQPLLFDIATLVATLKEANPPRVQLAVGLSLIIWGGGGGGGGGRGVIDYILCFLFSFSLSCKFLFACLCNLLFFATF